MRIESTTRSSTSTARNSAGRSASGPAFIIEEAAGSARAAATQPAASTGGIGALLALQAVEDPLLARKRKSLKRGNALLDTLEDIKADLLIGRVSEGRLNALMGLIAEARERKLPGLDEILDDIELRARVELAKFGRYPNLK